MNPTALPYFSTGSDYDRSMKALGRASKRLSKAVEIVRQARTVHAAQQVRAALTEFIAAMDQHNAIAGPHHTEWCKTWGLKELDPNREPAGVNEAEADARHSANGDAPSAQ